MYNLLLLVLLAAPFAHAGRGCTGNSCGTECCNPNTQRCVTPPGFRPSYCTSVGRSVLSVDNFWTKYTRVGYVNIKKIKSRSNWTIASLTKALDGHVVNATITKTKSLYKRDDVSAFFKPGRSVSALLINKSLIKHADAMYKNSTNWITTLSFCPIDNNNIVTLNVRINTHAKVVNATGLELTVEIKKYATLPHWIAIVGDSN